MHDPFFAKLEQVVFLLSDGHVIKTFTPKIDTANASNRKQYILITPQDMTGVSLGPTVRVHRMTDPERGQGVLAFQ